MKPSAYPFCLKRKRSSSLNKIVLCGLILVGSLAASTNVFAVSSYTNLFNSTYGTSGTRGANTIGSCITCHPGALNGSGTLNSYASDWLAAAHNLAAVEALDSDSDGYTNLIEIQAGTFPGDASSQPAPPAGTPPTAVAGANQTVSGGQVVTLNGAASSDADGTISTYEWTQIGGPAVILSNAAAAITTFNAPVATAMAQTLTFSLTVTDNSGRQGTDTCIITIAAGNQPPIADAGLDQTVSPGQVVILDGQGSTDPDGQIQTYQWVQTAGPMVTLSNTSIAQPSFTAPDPGTSGVSLTFELTVTDNSGNQATAICIVTVAGTNQPPIADAGGDVNGAMNILEGSTVTLDGGASIDPDGTIVSYSWQQIGTGPIVTLSDPQSSQATFVTPSVDTAGISLTFRLTVQDNGGLMASGQVTVMVADNGIVQFPSGVLPVITMTGSSVGVMSTGGGDITYMAPMDPSSLSGASSGAPQDLSLGLLDIEAKPAAVGGTVTITLQLPEPAPQGYSWYKFNRTTNTWLDYAAESDGTHTGAVFNATRDQVTLTLVDGGIGDDDGIADGLILDPSGLGAAASISGAPSNTGNAGSNDFGLSSGGGCFIQTLTGPAQIP